MEERGVPGILQGVGSEPIAGDAEHLGHVFGVREGKNILADHPRRLNGEHRVWGDGGNPAETWRRKLCASTARRKQASSKRCSLILCVCAMQVIGGKEGKVSIWKCWYARL